uniref:3'-5' exonuclease domain-containing protein n=1 Tax=Rhabditophanes sp. KR3021 TaxID=114890 RepID=A0AC35TMR2_9BILA
MTTYGGNPVIKALIGEFKCHLSIKEQNRLKFVFQMLAKYELKASINQAELFLVLFSQCCKNEIQHIFLDSIIDAYQTCLQKTEYRKRFDVLLTLDMKMTTLDLLKNKPKKYLNAVVEIMNLKDPLAEGCVRQTLKIMSSDPNEYEFSFWSDYFQIYDVVPINVYALMLFKEKDCKISEKGSKFDFIANLDASGRESLAHYFDKLLPMNVCFNFYEDRFAINFKAVERYYGGYEILQGLHKTVKMKSIIKLLTLWVRKFNISTEFCKRVTTHEIVLRLRHQYVMFVLQSKISPLQFYESLICECQSYPFVFETFVMSTIQTNKRYTYENFEICCNMLRFVPKLASALSEPILEQLKERECYEEYSFDAYISQNEGLTDLYNRVTKKYVSPIEFKPVLKFYKEIEIYHVESENHFRLALSMLKSAQTIGVDTEFSTDSLSGKLALIQVATEHFVILFDAVYVDTSLLIWEQLLDLLLFNLSSPVLLFGYRNDVCALKEAFKKYDFNKVEEALRPTIDLQFLYRMLEKQPTFVNFFIENNIKIQAEEGEKWTGCSKRESSLATVCFNLFGIELNKDDQCSAWRLRPLRKDMMRYAANDAYILIHIYNKMKSILNDDKLFQQMERTNESQLADKENEIIGDKKEDTFKEKKKNPPKSFDEIVAFLQNDEQLKNYENDAANFVLFPDSMVLNLRPVLLNLGFNLDREIGSPTRLEQHYKTIVLSQGKSLVKWRNLNRTLRTIEMKYTEPIEERVLSIFHALKIKLDVKVFFKRCLECTSNEIVKVPRLVILPLYYDIFCQYHPADPLHDFLSDWSIEVGISNIANNHPTRTNIEEATFTGDDYQLDLRKGSIKYKDGDWTVLPKQNDFLFAKVHHSKAQWVYCFECKKFATGGKN